MNILLCAPLRGAGMSKGGKSVVDVGVSLCLPRCVASILDKCC